MLPTSRAGNAGLRSATGGDSTSVREFAVLESLLRASPGFLSAETLLDQVWDENAGRFTDTVAVTTGRLRRKLGDPPVIAAAPGVGYRIA
jgi:DNA-binding response OmpR family regulator